jgi:aminoglycoside phosphotransferase (APT) family kinase protein
MRPKRLNDKGKPMNDDQVIIDAALVRHLIATQFPQWKDLPVQSVAIGGWLSFAVVRLSLD